jgi:choline dehydrogenase
MAEDPPQFDYVIVGSGAGGGPVAANLASAGFKVLLIEAGKEYKGLNYRVPGFHGEATQDPEMRWDFFVQHYSNPERNSRKYDSKYVDGKGVLYPRAGTLGGCTGHHALITIYPHKSDWNGMDAIARTYDPADRSWAPDRMRAIFERIERCGYVDQADGRGGSYRHGYDGWLDTNVLTNLLDPAAALKDLQLIQVIFAAANATIKDLDFNIHDPKAFDRLLDKVEDILENAPSLKELFKLRTPDEFKTEVKELAGKLLDPNRSEPPPGREEGVFLIPLSVRNGERVGSRQRINQVKDQFGDNLTIWSNTFVTRIVFEGKRAVAVEYSQGEKLYQAAPAPSEGRAKPAKRDQVRVKREVILAGGSFNTPQVLMLSGIGPASELAKHGIPVVSDLPAVGNYLQDRYEVGFISEFPANFKILGNNRFRKPEGTEPDDAALAEWNAHKTGLYAINGAVIAVIRKSSPGREDPDLFIFGLPAAFKGYYPGYASRLEDEHNRFTWAILKAHTENTGGYVKLRSPDPFVPPEINFKYFDEGTDKGGDDLNAMVAGVNFVRALTGRMGLDAKPLVDKDRNPPDLNDRQQIADWVMQEAWGHHACGTCRIGPKGNPKETALDSNFKVQGVDGLRVVDASVFPRIPGFFIVTPIYMIAEKASESILVDAGWKPAGAATGGLNLPKIN